MFNGRTNQIKRLANLILFLKFFLINHWKYYPTKNAKKNLSRQTNFLAYDRAEFIRLHWLS